jgi:tetratricopeptide (TPR) repeat protein
MTKTVLLPIILSFALAATGASGLAADPSPSPAASATADDTNAQDMLRGYLRLQEQLHATQLAIEQTRKESGETAAQSAQALTARLEAIERALSGQTAAELESVRSSNRSVLIVAGAFVVLGLGAMLLMGYFQWRTVERLAEISTALPPMRVLGPGPARAMLERNDAHVAVDAPRSSDKQLLATLARLEKRLYAMELASRRSLKEGAPAGNGLKPSAAPAGGNGGSAEAALNADASPVAGLLRKGQTLLDAGQAEAALACFDEALELAPGDGEALVKKGAALERLQKPDEAIECYDQAIAGNENMTIAYLHKGGLYNRMERFAEALECYEQALRTQETR